MFIGKCSVSIMLMIILGNLYLYRIYLDSFLSHLPTLFSTSFPLSYKSFIFIFASLLSLSFFLLFLSSLSLPHPLVHWSIFFLFHKIYMYILVFIYN